MVEEKADVVSCQERRAESGNHRLNRFLPGKTLCFLVVIRDIQSLAVEKEI